MELDDLAGTSSINRANGLGVHAFWCLCRHGQVPPELLHPVPWKLDVPSED